jgi:hypothetical protein
MITTGRTSANRVCSVFIAMRLDLRRKIRTFSPSKPTKPLVNYLLSLRDKVMAKRKPPHMQRGMYGG